VTKDISKSSRHKQERFRGRRRFEHWYVDNQVYFITARVRDQKNAFATDESKVVFRERFEHYAADAGFEPWVSSVLNNHYHTLGYLETGQNLKTMMQRLHGSVAKLVNDILENEPCASRFSGMRAGNRLARFWRQTKGKEYFDGCIRDVKQLRLAYRYTLTQSVRHGLCADWREYAHTWTAVSVEEAVRISLERDALMEKVHYPRYERDR